MIYYAVWSGNRLGFCSHWSLMGRFQEKQEIAGFVIQKPLGQGGFGETYLARDMGLDRLVVIKCLRNDLSQRLGGRDEFVDEFRARFWIEARAQARLNHPNACTIFEVDDDNQIIVMEYIDGETLEERLVHGALQKNDLIDVVIGICETMVEAHSKKVLHRDLTLKNVMITADEPPFTEFAAILGTPPYMSPEQQVRPKDVDARSDIFSFGVVIYRLVTGQFPYTQPFTTEPDADQPPPFSSFGVDPWPDLNLLVLTALQLKPQDRFETMQQVLGELTKIRQSLAQIERSLHFFDTSTLVEVVCPPVPTKGGRHRAKRAQDEFEIQHARDSAITSASVMAELLDQVLKIYFEAQQRGLNKDTHVQNVVADAKRELQRQRQRDARGGHLSWDGLAWEDKLLFLRYARGLFRPRMEAMASQLAVVEADVSILLSKYFDLAIDLQLPKRDARILAGAFALRASWVYSEEKRYARKSHQAVLETYGPNWYRLGEYVARNREASTKGSRAHAGSSQNSGMTHSMPPLRVGPR